MSRNQTTSLVLLLSLCAPALASGHIHRGPTAHRVAQHKAHLPRRSSAPRVMAPARATEIQNALIRNGYLAGSPSGVWDSSTEQAMQKYQAANGWQTRLTPDSRAIIKLGLGSGSTTQMQVPGAARNPAPAAALTTASETSASVKTH